MRTIRQVSRFKKDLKREMKGRHAKTLASDLSNIVQMLAEDRPLPVSYRDHALTGEWADHRDCHLKPDLVLIYAKFDDDELTLVRLGSHSELNL